MIPQGARRLTGWQLGKWQGYDHLAVASAEKQRRESERDRKEKRREQVREGKGTKFG